MIKELKDFYLLRRRYLNSQGTDNLYCLSDEEIRELESIENGLKELEKLKEGKSE